MAFIKDGYTLHCRDVKLKGGQNQMIYFFAKKKPKSGKPCEMPVGFKVGKNARTGLPYLKRG